MKQREMASLMILITGPDALDKKGGISTLTKTIIEQCQKHGWPYEFYHWKRIWGENSIKTIPKDLLEKSDWIINVHGQFSFIWPEYRHKMINFVHGSEITLYSKNPLKWLYKHLKKKSIFQAYTESLYNIFVSSYTLKKAISFGFDIDYSRDIIFHNVITPLQLHQKPAIKNKSNVKDLDQIVLVALARNVPHKNFVGSIQFANFLAEVSNKRILLHMTSDVRIPLHPNVDLVHLSSDKINNQIRDQYFHQSHFNLIFSLDRSSVGCFEGFGLTVLESALQGTPSLGLNQGGMIDSIHHGTTGYIFEKINRNSVEKWWHDLSNEQYLKICHQCYLHTVESHHPELLFSLINILTEKSTNEKYRIAV